MRHDLLPPPTTSRAELLPCAPPSPTLQLSPALCGGDFDDLGVWLGACSSPVPAGATSTDLFETDVHVRAQCDLLAADPPFDWEPSASLAMSELPLPLGPSSEKPLLLLSPHTLCPESPCSVTLGGWLQLAEPLLPEQPCSLDSLCNDLSESYTTSLLDTGDGDGNSAEGEFKETVKRERPTYLQSPQHAERPWYTIPTSASSISTGETSGKERLRKRQRAYEQKYRKKKRINFKYMRREWLHLEMELFALQIQQAEAVRNAPVETTLRERLVQLAREEKALVRCLAQRQTAKRWVQFFRIQLQGEEPNASPPKFPTTRHEWSTLVEAALGMGGACMPFVPAGFRFSWD